MTAMGAPELSGHETLQGQYDALVRSATVIRNFQIMLIPGLLQTPEYARYRALSTESGQVILCLVQRRKTFRFNV